LDFVAVGLLSQFLNFSSGDWRFVRAADSNNNSNMGKGWKKSGGGGGGGGAKGDLSSLRGSGCIIATCDVAREREATKELTNLLTQVSFFPSLLAQTYV
jgi:hypothetical protein